MNNMYKVWCTNKNEWEKNKTALLPNGTLVDLDHYNKPLRNDTHKVYHCIGIKDKNERLIYEGDMIKRIGICPTKDIGIIKYANGSFYLSGKRESYLIHFDYVDINKPTYEIIGNECENPELLEQYGFKPTKLNKVKNK